MSREFATRCLVTVNLKGVPQNIHIGEADCIGKGVNSIFRQVGCIKDFFDLDVRQALSPLTDFISRNINWATIGLSGATA